MVSLTTKLLLAVVALAVVGGVIAVIVVFVDQESDADTDGVASSTSTTEAPDLDGIVYEVGVGIADMTGPCVEVTFMGFAAFDQTGRGLHLRQFSRAFIFVKGDTRVVLVNTDIQAVGVHVRREVVNRLQQEYGDIYSLRNVIITGTHTHAAPGGHLVDFLLDFSIRGFSQDAFNAYVEGITRSIIRAHENIVPARLFYGTTRVANAQKNRSPYSYDFNPIEEKLEYENNVDDILTQVRIVKANGDLHGVLNWFAIHATSMNMTNRLVSSDNLGYAAITMEKTLNPDNLVGKPNIVAGFFTSNLGDVSPNLEEARCEFSGEICDNQFAICGAGERCYALGPGDDMFESTRIIGSRMYEGAMEVLNTPGEELTGDLAVIHQFIDMPDEKVFRYDPVSKTFNEDEVVSGCVPALGYSFGSGTTDGANTLNITQGTLDGVPLLDAVTGLVMGPTDEDIACHHPKPILLATGRANVPIPWHPRIVSASLIWLGGFAVLGVPGEPTTMSGRRMRSVVSDVMQRHGLEPRVVVSGLTNEYIHYIATFEEYQVQRYEAASTIYGPHTLEIFLNKFAEYASVAIEGGELPAGPEPPNYINNTVSLILPVVFDSVPLARGFGDVVEQPVPWARRGETISASFVGANPRNDLRQESSHAVIERLVENNEWTVVATDADWETKFQWTRTSTVLGTSTVTFEWTIPRDTQLGTHRVVYYGTARLPLGVYRQFTGTSNTFDVVI
ncbi:neutral ceramidase-like [Galleria mellonella]|uniref:Neutral ceramidase n=1 Tax=Galleria mellonella TaxID=7137 RepID=A0ABM3MUN8_GALME|nr:neutral ceramidase-like [Galleria mellonella]